MTSSVVILMVTMIQPIKLQQEEQKSLSDSSEFHGILHAINANAASYMVIKYKRWDIDQDRRFAWLSKYLLDTDVLNMGTGSRSWWSVNGAGCKPIYNSSHEDPFLFPTPTSVEGCVLEYFYIEAIQASLQIFLAHRGILNSRRVSSPLTRLGEGEKMWVAPVHPQRLVFSLKIE
ncbi:hypothetical protein TNCV_3112831 [Trichonephila clavipes]|nr:hypothetical protein TNCV_3112831 [Trichonephila clavipes]